MVGSRFGGDGARSPGLETQFSLDVDAFLEQDALEQRVLVAQHQTFVGGATVTLLEALKLFFITLDGSLELANVFSTALTKGGLRLSVALFALFGSSINL